MEERSRKPSKNSFTTLPSPKSQAVCGDFGRRLLEIAHLYRSDIMYNYQAWKHFTGLAPMRANRLLYDVENHSWISEPVLVQMDASSFSAGAFRECFKVKQIKGLELQATQKQGDCSSIPDLVRWTKRNRTCWVAKRYKNPEWRILHKQDVAMQMVAKRYAEAFNRMRQARMGTALVPTTWKTATHPVDFLMSHLIEFERNEEMPHDTPTFAVEAFVFGRYDNYNTNAGLVSSDLRRTPQAFSHFTFENSSRTLICVDVQGVDDLYTDPAVHSPGEYLWCKANLGFRGMALFFWSHRCNDACKLLQLPHFSNYRDQGMVANVSSTLHNHSHIHGGHSVKELAAATLTMTSEQLKEDWPSRRRRSTYLRAHLLWPDFSQWCELPVLHHPEAETAMLPTELIEPCIHMELCWLFSTGRLARQEGEDHDSADLAAVFHLQLAARGGLRCALLALARVCSDFPHKDFLPRVIGAAVLLCMKLLELAAERGSAAGAGSLAILLEHGTYDEPNHAKAARMYERFAEIMLGEEKDVGHETDEGRRASRTSSGFVGEAGEMGPAKSLEESEGMSRPTGWDDCFGWENHGLTAHGALAAAGRLYNEELTGFPRNRIKAAELYRKASDQACDAREAKLAMKYGEISEAIKSEKTQSILCQDDGNEGDKVEAAPARLPTMTLDRLQRLGQELGIEDVGEIVELLLRSYRQQEEGFLSPIRAKHWERSRLQNDQEDDRCLFFNAMDEEILDASTGVTSGNLHVQVLDAAGIAIEGAKVFLIDSGAAVVATGEALTDSKGRVSILHPIGTFGLKLLVEKPGFKCSLLPV